MEGNAAMLDLRERDIKEMNDSELADESKGEATPNPGTTSASQTLGLSALDPSFPLSELLRSGGISTHHEMASSIHKQFQSPFSWPLRRKAAVLTSPFFAAMLAAYSAGAYAMAAPPLQQRWQVTPTEFNIGITIFVAGFGFAPMTLAPVSEAYGRYWVFVGSGVVFFLGTLGCALTNSYAGMLVSRLVTGSGASVFATLTGGVVGDVFRKEDRNTPMALYSLAILVGTGLGPLISGITVDRLGWRWIFYLQLVFIGSTTLAILLTFTETRSNVLLQRKCAALNSCMERRGYSLRFQSQFAEEGFDLNIIWKSFAFPMRLLITEPVVFCFSMWASFAWAILYMQFNSIGIVFRDVYGFDSTRVGAVFTAVIVASILSTCLAICQNHVLLRLWPHRMATPEGRLLSPSLQSILLPIGLFWFGWTARANVSWVSPALAIASCTMGIFSIYLAVFNYLADTYGPFGSSAQAAQSMCRNLLAGIFPLVTHIMLRNLTYAGAGSLLGGLGLVLTAIPWALSFYGHQIRARSLFAKTVIEMHH